MAAEYITVQPEEKYVLTHPQILKRRRLNANFNNPDVAREWLKRSHLYAPTDPNQYNPTAQPPKHSIFDLLDKSHALIANKERDLGSYRTMPYRGQTITNASPNQIKLLGLEQHYANKSAPYHKKMQRNLQTNFDTAPVDFKTARLNEIRNQALSTVNHDFLRSIFGDRLDKQRLSNLYADTNKNLNSGLNVASREYEKIDDANRLQQKAKQNLVHGVLGKLAEDKQSKRDLYLHNLKSAANQEHGLRNLQLLEDKFKYDEEQAAPARKLQALKQKLANITSGGIREDMGSNVLDARGEQLSELLSKYEDDYYNQGGYRGSLVGGINPTLQNSWDQLNQMSPNYKSSVYGDALLALVQAHPSFEDVQEAFDEKTNTATCTVKRKNQSEYTVSFSAEDAKKAGLWGKAGPWTQYPKRMLQMRARGFALRDKFADALSGLIMAEEAQDYSSISDVTPKTQTLSSKLDNLIAKQVQEVNEPIVAIEEQNAEKLQELSALVLQHNISDEIIDKWCNKAGVGSLDELDNSKIESCINYINSQYSYADKIEAVAHE